MWLGMETNAVLCSRNLPRLEVANDEYIRLQGDIYIINGRKYIPDLGSIWMLS
jgi:hypothetical protein